MSSGKARHAAMNTTPDTPRDATDKPKRTSPTRGYTTIISGHVAIISEHITIVLAAVFLIFVVLDWFNPLMGFFANQAATPFLIAFCLAASFTALYQRAMRR